MESQTQSINQSKKKTIMSHKTTLSYSSSTKSFLKKITSYYSHHPFNPQSSTRTSKSNSLLSTVCHFSTATVTAKPLVIPVELISDTL
jgi:hypothetical protein